MRRRSVGDLLGSLPIELSGLVEAVRRVAHRRSVEIHLVGGPVRDWLLDRPLHDVDLLVGPGGDAEAIAREAAPDGSRLTVHERFRTVKIASGAARLDLASARRETYARPGALPRVEAGTLEEDLHRRDFSVNAMAIRLGEDDEPAVVFDPEDGRSDLAERRLRVLHGESFHDDPTRALRAARLAPRLGFSLTRASRGALRAAIRSGSFGAVSGERLRREFERMFTDVELGGVPADSLRRLEEWHVLPALEPGLGLPRDAVAPLRRLGRALADPPWRASRLRPWVVGLAVWLAPLRPSLRWHALERLAVRGDVATRVAGFPKALPVWSRGLDRARGRGAVDAVLHGADEESLLALYVCADSVVRRRIARWATEDRGRRMPLSGGELTELGLQGPAVGRALARIRAAYLDGALANREEALALARELAARRSRRSGTGGRRGDRTSH